MRITIALGAFFPVPTILGGAVEKAWLELAKEFTVRGNEVTMISRRYASLPKREVLDGVRHVRVAGFDAPKSVPWLKMLDLIYSLRARHELPDADILVTNTFWLPLLKLPKRCGCIYVHVARHPKGQLRFYRNAARLQAPSEGVADEIRTQAPLLADRVRTVPYPAPESFSAAVLPVNERPRTVLYAGRVHPEKGVHLLVESFAQHARTVFAGWQLMIVGPASISQGGGGDAYLEKLRQLAAPAGATVTFAGPSFAPGALAETMRQARILVYPSLADRGETFGLAILEAMSSGCAVLVSNLNCFRDFVSDGQTGYIFDQNSADPVQTLGDAFRKMVANETKLAEVSGRGYEKAKEYSVSRVAERFRQDFQSILENGDGRTATG